MADISEYATEQVTSGYDRGYWEIHSILGRGWTLREVPKSETGDGYLCFTPPKGKEEHGIGEIAYVSPRSQNYEVHWAQTVWPSAFPRIYQWWLDDTDHRPYRHGQWLIIKKDVINMKGLTPDQNAVVTGALSD